jgi:hypothetical protein
MNQTPPPQPPRKRLDQMVAPGWANLCSNLLRGGGTLVGLLLLWLGFLTGGFFIALTGVLAAISIVGGWLLGGLVVRESWYESPNAQLKSWALVIGLPVVLLAFAQVAGPMLTPPPATAACYSGTPPRGGELHTQLAIDPRVHSMRFTLKVSQISGGAVRWFILDPSGNSVWSGRKSDAGNYVSDELPGAGGQWTINVISEADTLNYELDWVSLDPAGDAGSTAGCHPV